MKKIFFIILFAANLFAQDKDPNKILDVVKDEYAKVHDYSVDVVITVDINYVKVPQTHAQIFFKQPNKVKMKSEGFAMLPKEGMDISPAKILTTEYDAIYVKNEVVDGKNLDVIKVIPRSDSSKIILSTIWVDMQQKVIRKVESTTKGEGTFQVEFKYAPGVKYPLPSEATFSFNLGNLRLPQNPMEKNKDQQDNKKKKPGAVIGTVNIKYNNYKVNQGIPDSVFDEEKDSKKE